MTALGLQKDPFSPEPDSLFYYSFDSFEQRLKVLHGLIQGSDLFILIIGEPGSGKTTLLNRYLATTDIQWKSARILADSETALSQSSERREHKGYPAYIFQESANPIVIVDDAHQLPQKEMEFLIHEALVPGRSKKIKRLVLFGESDLYTAVTELASTLTAQPAVSKIYLPGLTAMQTADYLKHRLAIGGYSGEFFFNSSVIKNIHQTSGGYPGPINEIARQWLNEKYSSKEEGQNMLKNLSATPRRMVTWIATGVIIILLAAFWLFSDRKPWSPKPPDQKLTKTVFRKKIVQPPKPVAQPVSEKVTAAVTPDKPPAAIKPQQTPETKTTPEPPTPIKTAAPKKEEALAPEPPDKPPAAIKPQQTPETKTTPKPPTPIKTAAPKKEEALAPESTITAAPKTDSRPKTELQPALKPIPKEQPPVSPETAAREIRREKWLLSQDATFYTIQIIGVSTEKSMLDFIKKYQLLEQNEIAYYESTFNGKPWYQALYGLYPTKEEAQLAADTLPENIHQAGPWIRRLSGVQQAIGK